MDCTRLARVSIERRTRELRVGKLGWHGNIDTEFEKGIP